MVQKVSLTGTIHLHLLGVQLIIFGLLLELRVDTKTAFGFVLASLGLGMGVLALLVAIPTLPTEPNQSAEN